PPRSLSRHSSPSCVLVFFFTHPSPTELYTLSLHDALPISARRPPRTRGRCDRAGPGSGGRRPAWRERPLRRPGSPGSGRGQVARDRKSTRLNSSHVKISYAVFCLKKKKKQHTETSEEPNAN